MSALHRHRFGGQTLTHDHIHDAPHGYFGHPEDHNDDDRAVAFDARIFPGTYERVDTATTEPPNPDLLTAGDREYLQALIDIDNGEHIDEYGADTDRINTYLNALEVAQ